MAATVKRLLMRSPLLGTFIIRLGSLSTNLIGITNSERKNDHMEGSQNRSNFIQRVLIIMLVIVLIWMIWQLKLVLILAFGAALLAVVINSLASAISNRLLIPGSVAFVTSLVCVFGTPVLAMWIFGGEIASQTALIREALPGAIEAARVQLAEFGLAKLTEESLGAALSGSRLYDSVTGMLFSVADMMTNLVLVAVGSIYMASSPALYRRGFLKLFPSGRRDLMGQSLDDITLALKLWLKGRLLAMVLVGILTGAGLWALGIPSYMALGILAALLEFIPFFGPIIAAVPAILLAMLGGPTDALLVVGLFLVIQQLEGNVITPMIQQRAVDLPPVLLIFAVLAFGTLFGLIGVVLAAPLTVVIFVLVKRLYVRGYLDTQTDMPGSKDTSGQTN